jgi:hypothetical protein
MKKNILLTVFSLMTILGYSQREIKSNGSLTNNYSSNELTQIDFNYLNKGYWELELNGYPPRTDLKLIKTYAAKQESSNWYFMVHKVCKDSKYFGYIITGKPDFNSTTIHNIYFFKQFNSFIENHNRQKISTLSGIYLSYFSYRSTTLSLYNLDEKCD